MRKKKPYEGTIWKHGKKFYACYWVRGKPYREPFNSYQEAETRLIAITLRKHKGRAAIAANLRIGELLDLALTDLRVNDRRSVGVESRRVKSHLKPRFENWKVADFRSSDVEEYKMERKAEGASNATINRELSLLIKGFNLAFNNELIDYKVPIKRFKERSERKRPFSEGEFKTFCTHLPDDVLAATLFQHEAGWRMPSEVLPLQWNQVDFNTECVTLSPYTTKDDSPEPREFFFTARMRELLQQQRAYVDDLQKKYKKIICWVFPDSEGNPLFRVVVDEGIEIKRWTLYFKKAWQQAQKESGTLLGTHNLRVTACVERDNAGLSIVDNMNAGGWRSDVMLRRYLNKSREDKKSAAKKLDEFRSMNKQTVTKPSQSKG